jgi:hypothetical protein
MKKGLGLIAVFTAIVSCAPAAVPDNTVHGVLIAGSVKNSGTFNAVYWDAGVLNTLDSRESAVFHSFRDGSDLYVLGYYSDTLGDRHYGYWKNGSFSQLGYSYSSTRKIAVSGGNVYVAGKMTNTSVGYWENGVYHTLYSSGHYFMQATGLAVSGTNIAVVGSTNFLYSKGYWLNSVYYEVTNMTGIYSPYFVGGVLRILCRTNNNELGYLENGVYSVIIATNFYPQSVDIYGADVYICGSISPSGDPLASYLKNGQLFCPGSALPFGSIGKAIQYNNEVYLAGIISDNTNTKACYWKTGWSSTVLDNRESYAETINN